MKPLPFPLRPAPCWTGAAVLCSLLTIAACQGKGSPTGPLATPAPEAPLAGSLLDPLPEALRAPGTSGTGTFAVLAGTIDFAHTAIGLTPLRLAAAAGDTYDLDATDFFTRQPCADCVRIASVARNAEGDLEVAVALRHPFTPAQNRPDLAVFDVRGILIVPGTTAFPAITADLDGDGTAVAGEILSGNVDLVRNADGYTTRFDSRAEDPAIVGTPMQLAGSMNPFLRYADNPGTAPLDPHTPSGRNVFAPGMSATRTWVLRPPQGATQLPFMFVVDAAYGAAGSRQEPVYRLPEFQRKEAWAVEASIANNQLLGGIAGSSADLEVRVKDWQQGATVAASWPAAELTHVRAASTVHSVMASVPGMLNLATANTPQSGSGAPDDPLLFRLTLTNQQSAPSGTYTALVAVRDALSQPGAVNPFPLPPGITRGTPMDIRDYTTYVTVPVQVDAGQVSAQAPLPFPIIYATQEPVTWSGSLAGVVGNFGWVSDGGDGKGNLWRLDPNGTKTNLTNFYRGAVRKPVLNYNGTRVAFAAKVGSGGANWQVYTMDPNGQNLTNLSRNTYNDFDPDFLPDGRLVFASDRDGWRDPYNEGIAPQLYLMDANGNNHRRLTYSGSGDYWPVVLADGRISFRRWDNLRVNSEKTYMPTALGLPYGFPENFWMSDINGCPLWVVNPDGTFPDLFYGSHLTRNRRAFMDHSELPDGKLLAVATPFSRTWGSGTIAILDPAEYDNVEIPRYQTEPEAAQDQPSAYGRYRTPIQLADGRFIATYAPGTVYDDGSNTPPDFHLVVVDSEGNRRTLTDTGGTWEWMPLELKPRPQPATIPPTATSQNWGILASANIFLRDAREPESKDPQPIPFPEAGYVVRFFAAILSTDEGLHEPFDKTNIVRPHEYLGEAPVRSDGSFAVMLPAHRPITWQVVGPDNKVKVVERFYTNVAPGEVRFCQGCHAPQRPGAFPEKTYQQTLASQEVTDLRP